MCTLTWAPQGHGFAIGFNRDERLGRPSAIPPRIGECRCVQYIAPVDPEGGGTWIGVNSLGVALCLLNRYDDVAVPVQPISRGCLVAGLLDLAATDDLPARIPRSDLVRYRPFTLAAFGPGGAMRALNWNGARLEESATARPGLVAVSSSAGRHIEVQRAALIEQELAARPILDVDRLEALHRLHRTDSGAASVCMHRDDAATVSSSLIEVSDDRVLMRYGSGAPCLGGATIEVQLTRQVLVPVE